MITCETLADSLVAHEQRLAKALTQLNAVAHEDDDEAFERSEYRVAALRKRIQEIKSAIAAGQS